jgi:hypothetical protein
MKGRKNMAQSTKRQMQYLLWSRWSATGGTNLLLREIASAETLRQVQPNSVASKAEEKFR